MRAKNPHKSSYPAELKTLGDHLRKVRLDRGLSQKAVANLLNVQEETVFSWELNRNVPSARHMREIASFIGYTMPVKV